MEKGNGFSPQNRLKSFGALIMIGNTYMYKWSFLQPEIQEVFIGLCSSVFNF